MVHCSIGLAWVERSIVGSSYSGIPSAPVICCANPLYSVVVPPGLQAIAGFVQLSKFSARLRICACRGTQQLDASVNRVVVNASLSRIPETPDSLSTRSSRMPSPNEPPSSLSHSPL